jgi:O-antigen/teichoic acid export membrane protein
MYQKLSALPKALQQSLVYASALAISKGLALIMVPVATHYLTPTDYGRLDILQTLADLLSIVIGMGLAETLFRFAGSETDEKERKLVCANIFSMTLLLGVFALFLGQIFAVHITSWLPGDIATSETRLILASLSLVGTIIVPLAWLRMQNNAWLYLLGSAGRVMLQVAIAIPLLILGFGVFGVLCAALTSAIALCVYLSWKQYKDTGIRFDFARFRAYSCYGGPLVFVGMAGFVLGSFDRWILADIVGTADMAQYALATKFGLITAVLIQPFDLWWHARRFSCLKEENGHQRCADYACAGIIIALFSCLIIAAIGPSLVRLLTPQTYHASIQFIPWLALLAAVHNATATIAFGAMSKEHTLAPAIIDGSAAAIALLGYFILIPHYFAWGAITATSIALSYRFIVTYNVSQRALLLPYPIINLIIVSILALGILMLMPDEKLSLIGLTTRLGLIMLFLIIATLLGLLPLVRKFAFINILRKSK